jgi:hypothetical protein
LPTTSARCPSTVEVAPVRVAHMKNLAYSAYLCDFSYVQGTLFDSLNSAASRNQSSLFSSKRGSCAGHCTVSRINLGKTRSLKRKLMKALLEQRNGADSVQLPRCSLLDDRLPQGRQQVPSSPVLSACGPARLKQTPTVLVRKYMSTFTIMENTNSILWPYGKPGIDSDAICITRKKVVIGTSLGRKN